MNEPVRDLTRGPIATTLLLFSLPILGGNVLQSLNGSINAVWIGGHLGESALAAIANANNVLFVLLGAVFGLGMAATILVAQASGRGDLRQARHVIGSAASFFVGLSVLVAILGQVVAGPLLSWLGTPTASVAQATAYLRVIFLAIPFLYALAFVSAVLRGAGDARTPLAFLVAVVVLDVILVPLLMFGIGPFPVMGIAGAALASLVANGLSLAALLLWLRHRRHPFWIARADLRLYRPDPVIIRTLLAKGLPMGLQVVMVSLAMLTMITLVNRHGLETTAAYGAAMQLWTYVQMPAMAIGAACSSMAGQNVGAGRWDRVASVARVGVAFNFLLTGTVIVLLLALETPVLALFLPDGSAVLEPARHINHIVIGSFLFFGVTFVLFGVVRSTGAVLAPLILLGLALWGIRIPFASGMQAWLGADAIWWSFPVSAACAMAMSVAYYRWGRWRQARMLPGDEDEIDDIAVPAEVVGPPPAPVADPALCRRRRRAAGEPATANGVVA